jgi:hypothetical protein
MNKYGNLVNKLIATADPKAMQELTTILDDHFGLMETVYPDLYWPVVHKLHVLVNGPHFDKECAEYAVSQMINQDGTIGEHWTIVQTLEVATKAGILFDEFNEFDWYYVMNMIHSDHFETFDEVLEDYVAFADEWLCDKDAPKGKAYLYYEMLSSGK